MELYQVLRRPIVTEKSNYLSDAMHRYTFEVDRRATKQLVRAAVETIFEVEVVKVNIMNVRGKSRRFGRIQGRTSDWRKAIVVLV